MKKDKNRILETLSLPLEVPAPTGKNNLQEVVLGKLTSLLSKRVSEVKIFTSVKEREATISFLIKTCGFTSSQSLTIDSADFDEGAIQRLDGREIQFEDSRFIVRSSGDLTYAFNTQTNLESGLGKEQFELMNEACKRASGVVFIQGNSKSSLDTCFHQFSELAKSRFGDGWGVISMSHSEMKLETPFSSTITTSPMEDALSLNLSLWIVEDSGVITNSEAIALAKSGSLVIKKTQGGNSMHFYSNLFKSTDYADISNYVLGVGTTNLLPIFKDNQNMNSETFEKSPYKPLLANLESSLIASDRVFNYGKYDFDNEIIDRHVDLFDFVPLPPNLRLFIAEDGSATDLYPLFKNKLKSLNVCLDMAASLTRAQKTSIDLVAHFVTPN